MVEMHPSTYANPLTRYVIEGLFWGGRERKRVSNSPRVSSQCTPDGAGDQPGITREVATTGLCSRRREKKVSGRESGHCERRRGGSVSVAELWTNIASRAFE